MKLTAVALLLTLTGCAYFPDATDRLAIAAGRVVNTYCDKITDQDRQIFGDKVRAEASPDAIAVTCSQ